MKKHYELQPYDLRWDALVFDWDEETGEVSGPSAERIQRIASGTSTCAHPAPWGWTFSAAPLKNKTDMAAIVGYEHKLPSDLAPFYPKLPDDGTPEVSYTDANGVFYVGRDLLLY